MNILQSMDSAQCETWTKRTCPQVNPDWEFFPTKNHFWLSIFVRGPCLENFVTWNSILWSSISVFQEKRDNISRKQTKKATDWWCLTKWRKKIGHFQTHPATTAIKEPSKITNRNLSLALLNLCAKYKQAVQNIEDQFRVGLILFFRAGLVHNGHKWTCDPSNKTNLLPKSSRTHFSAKNTSNDYVGSLDQNSCLPQTPANK